MTSLFLTYLGISATAGATIILVALASPFIDRRYSAKWKYFIWIFLTIRLLVPLSGIYRKSAENPAETENKDAALAVQPEISGETIYLRQPQRFVVEIPVHSSSAAPAAESAQKAEQADMSFLDVAAIIWLTGAAVFAGIHVFSYRHFKRKVMRHGERITDGEAFELMQSLKTELRIRRNIALIRYAEAPSPMIIGFIKPVLVLPDGSLDSSELYFIIRHELIHQKRHDVYAKLLCTLANAVHWFNPIVWLMRKEFAIDMELSCDEGVVKGAAFDVKKAYTETLMSALTRRTSNRVPLSTQFYGGKNTMKKRFKNILTKSSKKNGIFVLVFTIIAATLLGTLVGCTEKAPLPSDDELGDMIWKYLEFEGYSSYSNPEVDFEHSYSEGTGNEGDWSYPVTQEGLTTWQNWLDYLKGIFTDKGVEAALEQTAQRYVNYDGNLYYRDGGMGWTLSEMFVLSRVEETADNAFTAEFWREYDPDFTESGKREFMITELDFKYTGSGWRIAQHRDREATNSDSLPNIEEFNPFGITDNSLDIPVTDALNEENVKNLIYNYQLFERYTVYDSVYYDTDPNNSVTVDGNDYYPVTEDDLTTYQQWCDFIHRIFTNEVAEEYLKQQFEEDKRFANVDGKLYCLDMGGMGWYLSTPCQMTYNETDGGAGVEYWQEYLDEGSEGEYRITVFNLKSQADGWRIESFRHYNTYDDLDGFVPALKKPDSSER